MKEMKKYLAEFIGTFVLVLFACGTAVVVGCGTPAGYLATAIAFGLVIVAMAYSIGNISGCHINPAVSFAMLILKKIDVKDFCGYVVAQFVGAIAGAGVLGYLTGGFDSLGQNGLYDGDVAKSLIIEIILTFIFVIAIIGVTSKAEFSSAATPSTRTTEPRPFQLSASFGPTASSTRCLTGSSSSTRIFSRMIPSSLA